MTHARKPIITAAILQGYDNSANRHRDESRACPYMTKIHAFFGELVLGYRVIILIARDVDPRGRTTADTDAILEW